MSFLLEILLGFFWWIVLFPAIWIVATPFILVFSFMSKLPYEEAVKGAYRKVTDFWAEWGTMFTP